MYKNQLQELAQRSCFNLPSYTCLREGPDHAPRFKAAVNFNGEIFESPNFCTTLRQAEHTAAEVALSSLSNKGPSQSLAARILDETGVYKNLLQEISQRVGASLPLYTTFRSGRGHLPVFTCNVELAGITFTGEPAKNKKQAEKNAAMAAWSSLKQLVQQSERPSSEWVNNDEQEHITIARALRNYHVKAQMANLSFPVKFPMQNPRPSSTQPPFLTTSKILPLIFSDALPQSSSRSLASAMKDCPTPPLPYNHVRNFRACQGIAPQVTVRNAIPVFSAPSLQQFLRTSPSATTPRVNVRQAVPVSAASPVRLEEPLVSKVGSGPPASSLVRMEETETRVMHEMKELKI